MGDFYQSTGSLLPVIHPVKFGKENLWTYILSPLMIWQHLDRRGPYHEELLRNVSMKYYIFEFLPE